MMRKSRKQQLIIFPNRVWKTKKTSRRQIGGFLNWYDFAYAGRNTVNQVSKIAPNIKQATGELNKIAQQRIDQVLRSGGAEIKLVTPKIIMCNQRSMQNTIQTSWKFW